MTHDPGRMLELAGLSEVATGPDRELDAAIHGAVGDEFRRYQIERLGAFGPAYTASLDAAMTLVPLDGDGGQMNASVGWINSGNGIARGLSSVSDRLCGPAYTGNAATPALALCAAALRALASEPASSVVHDDRRGG